MILLHIIRRSGQTRSATRALHFSPKVAWKLQYRLDKSSVRSHSFEIFSNLSRKEIRFLHCSFALESRSRRRETNQNAAIVVVRQAYIIPYLAL